jgi:aquaporin Z
MVQAIKLNWKTYLMEAICLGIFMISASVFATLLEYPESPVRVAIPNNFIRLCLMGVAMGGTAMVINYSPMGRLSGAHMNPAVTLTFVGLGKMKFTDAVFYLIFQLAGGMVAVELMAMLIGAPFREEHVNYVVTIPGRPGVATAFLLELMMAFAMMLMVLVTSNQKKFASYTGVIAGIFVMAYVILSGPISGFSINPTRTIASAVPSGVYTSFWIYMIAPFIGMFSAAGLYKAIGGRAICAKMNHNDNYDCIFNCGYCKHQTQQENLVNRRVKKAYGK